MVSLAFVAAVMTAVVEVEGNTSCPAPELVALRLGELLAPQATTDRPDKARLRIEGNDVVIVLERADGELLGTRRLPLLSGCEDLAAAVAVSLATWESDVHPEFAPRLGAPPPTVVLDTRASPPPPAVAPQPWTVAAGVSLAVGGSIDGPAMAGGGALGAWVTPYAARTSVRAELEGQTERHVMLQDGRAFWRRWTLGLGFERSFFAAAADAPPLEAAGGGRLRWFALGRIAQLAVHGDGFPLNRGDNSLDAGVTVGIRTVWRRGPWASWLELAGSAWPLGHDVAVGGSGVSARLPAVEAFLRLGAGRASAW